MNVVDIALITLLSPLVLILSLHSLYLIAGSRVDMKYDSKPTSEKTVSVVVPIKNEPLSLVLDCVKHLSKVMKNLGSRSHIYIVSDDEEEYVESLKNELRSLNTPVAVEVVRHGGRGGRVGSLNFALREVVDSDTLLVLDVDARPSEEFFEELLKCARNHDVCVGRWVGYWSRNTRVSAALAFSTELVSAALYGGRRSFGLLIFPLGSGTLFNVNSLRSVGGWEDGTMQDDVIIGMKLHGAGYSIEHSPRAVVRVLVPSSYRAFRIQQLKWAYGSLESLRYSFKYLNRDIGFLKSFEARLYTLQYLPGLTVLVASLIVPSLALAVGVDLSLHTVLLIGIPTSLYVATVLKNAVKRGYRPLKTLRTLGCASAIGLAVAPVVIKGLVMGALGMRPRAPVTPKGPEDREKFGEYIEEYTAAAISLSLGISALFSGYYMVSGLGFLPAVALLYTLLRATR
ncbi:MAG: glycosyltransferase family 2 protein [Sulfolobales archaeon]|nr:glycosyltransferase family 2 protein [Sulfolobales archaeon]MDW8082179.1 glycosyltransferase family 2 protein [Sulfolobales archaeon]